ncbi:Fe-S cluster assembly sulfur transfer protein SufU [Microbacterium pumilum]|uniref:SUF system NifU family Fe-S cluster assembly protein n=1 Tax=Microbacterium pumilum TaxID=344165 RepID=A0ABN2S780_9MICO
MSDLENLYREVLLDHSRRPEGRGDISGFAVTHHELNPSCGDEITLGMSLAADGTIDAIGWEGQGCSISTASASIMTGLLEGEHTETAREMIGEFRAMLRSPGAEPPERLGDAAAFQGVARYVMRVKCAMLAWVAAEACLLQLGAADEPQSSQA